MTYLFIILLFLTGKSVLLWQRGVDVLTAQSLMVSPDHRYKLLADHTLEIRNIKPSDGGDYACKISVLGDPIEIKHTLEILRKPFCFLLVLKKCFGQVGISLHFQLQKGRELGSCWIVMMLTKIIIINSF